MKVKNEERNISQRLINETDEKEDESELQDSGYQEEPEQEYAEDDSLQSVESEQIDSFYSEGMYYSFYYMLMYLTDILISCKTFCCERSTDYMFSAYWPDQQVDHTLAEDWYSIANNERYH